MQPATNNRKAESTQRTLPAAPPCKGPSVVRRSRRPHPRPHVVEDQAVGAAGRAAGGDLPEVAEEVAVEVGAPVGATTGACVCGGGRTPSHGCRQASASRPVASRHKPAQQRNKCAPAQRAVLTCAACWTQTCRPRSERPCTRRQTPGCPPAACCRGSTSRRSGPSRNRRPGGKGIASGVRERALAAGRARNLARTRMQLRSCPSQSDHQPQVASPPLCYPLRPVAHQALGAARPYNVLSRLPVEALEVLFGE